MPESKNPSSDAASQNSKESNRPGIVDKIRQTATSQLTDQKNRATDGLGSVAQAVRQTTQTLRNEQHETIAGYVDQAADQIERLSQRLRDRDVSQIFTDLQQLSRRQPALFIGGAFVAGFLGARFLKSTGSESESYRQDNFDTMSGERRDEYRSYANSAGEVSYPSTDVSTVHDKPRRSRRAGQNERP